RSRQATREEAQMPFRILTIAVALVSLPAAALAQASGSGTLIGRIVDSSGAVLPGVTVTLKSPEALGQYTAVTDAQGLYRVANIPPAAYDAKAELQGFQTAIHHVTVRIGTTLTVDFTLSVGSMTETVNVSV